jgi:hypothetical protein
MRTLGVAVAAIRTHAPAAITAVSAAVIGDAVDMCAAIATGSAAAARWIEAALVEGLVVVGAAPDTGGAQGNGKSREGSRGPHGGYCWSHGADCSDPGDATL